MWLHCHPSGSLQNTAAVRTTPLLPLFNLASMSQTQQGTPMLELLKLPLSVLPALPRIVRDLVRVLLCAMQIELDCPISLRI